MGDGSESLEMDALAALRLQLEWGADEALLEEPVDRFARAAPPPRPVPAPVPVPTPPPAAIVPAQPVSLNGQVARAQALAEAARTREELRTALETFDGCPLKDTAMNLVFSDGNPEAGLMLVGETMGDAKLFRLAAAIEAAL